MLALGAAALTLSGCAVAAASGRTPTASAVHGAASNAPTGTSAPATSTTSTTATTAATTSTSAAPSPPVTPPKTTTPPASAPPAPTPPTDVAGQQIAVSAGGYGQTTATFTAYQRTTQGWRVAYGPWTADIGYTGFAPPGQKHEGDGHTPSGMYPFGFAFGVQADPGVHLEYRPVTGPNIVWDDDASSPRYNQWVDTNTADAGANPEPMDNSPAYDYGAVIDYNAAPVVPGAGSAIFLHVSTGGTTAGCVSLPRAELLDVLRWLDPAQQPSISMGVGVGHP